MMSTELAALKQALKEEAARYIAAHPEEFADTDEQGWCHACENARTILVCARGHRAGCDCAEIEVPCHACR